MKRARHGALIAPKKFARDFAEGKKRSRSRARFIPRARTRSTLSSSACNRPPPLPPRSGCHRSLCIFVILIMQRERRLTALFYAASMQSETLLGVFFARSDSKSMKTGVTSRTCVTPSLSRELRQTILAVRTIRELPLSPVLRLDVVSRSASPLPFLSPRLVIFLSTRSTRAADHTEHPMGYLLFEDNRSTARECRA